MQRRKAGRMRGGERGREGRGGGGGVARGVRGIHWVGHTKYLVKQIDLMDLQGLTLYRGATIGKRGAKEWYRGVN